MKNWLLPVVASFYSMTGMATDGTADSTSVDFKNGLEITVDDLFCGEFDPYLIGDACLIETKLASGKKVNLLVGDNKIDSYEVIEGLKGKKIELNGSDLKLLANAEELEIIYGSPLPELTTLEWNGKFDEKVDCYEFLTNGYSQDSRAFQITESDLVNIDDTGIELAESAVNQLISDSQCKLDIPLDFGRSDCREIVPGVATSTSCYIEASLGYFLTSEDYLGNINIVFNRWD